MTVAIYPKGAEKIDKWGKAYYYNTKDLKAGEYIIGLLWDAEKGKGDYTSQKKEYKMYNLMNPKYMERESQFYVYDVYVRGQDITEYKYETNIHNVTTKSAVWGGPRLDWFEAKCELDFGPTSSIYEMHGGFLTLPKISLANIQSFDTYDWKESHFLDYNVNVEEKTATSSYNKFILRIQSFNQAAMTIDALKEEINLILIEGSSYATTSDVRQSTVILFNELSNVKVYYPFYNLAEKREVKKTTETPSTDNEKKQSKLGKAFSNVKSSYIGTGGGSSYGSSWADKYRKYVANNINDLKWEPATWGNITGQAISLDLYLSHQVYSNRTDHTKKLKKGEEGKTRKLDVFVFEHNGHVFFVSMIKQGYGPNTVDSEKDKAFVKNIKQNIKAI